MTQTVHMAIQTSLSRQLQPLFLLTTQHEFLLLRHIMPIVINVIVVSEREIPIYL